MQHDILPWQWQTPLQQGRMGVVAATIGLGALGAMGAGTAKQTGQIPDSIRPTVIIAMKNREMRRDTRECSWHWKCQAPHVEKSAEADSGNIVGNRIHPVSSS